MNKYLYIFLLIILSDFTLFSFDGYLSIINRTGYNLNYIFLSHEDSETWEENVLSEENLEEGETYQIDIKGYNSPVFDIKAVDENDTVYYFWNLDIEYNNLALTSDYKE